MLQFVTQITVCSENWTVSTWYVKDNTTVLVSVVLYFNIFTCSSANCLNFAIFLFWIRLLGWHAQKFSHKQMIKGGSWDIPGCMLGCYGFMFIFNVCSLPLVFFSGGGSGSNLVKSVHPILVCFFRFNWCFIDCSCLLIECFLTIHLHIGHSVFSLFFVLISSLLFW